MQIKKEYRPDNNAPYFSWYFLEYEGFDYNFQVPNNIEVLYLRDSHSFISFIKFIIHENRKRLRYK